jgi:hypothetical protein
MDYYEPLKAGDTCWTPVTDHPKFSKVFYEGQPYLFREQAVAERIAAAWNSYRPAGSEYPFYVKSFVLQPMKPEPEETGQLSLWEGY